MPSPHPLPFFFFRLASGRSVTQEFWEEEAWNPSIIALEPGNNNKTSYSFCVFFANEAAWVITFLFKSIEEN